MSKVRYIIKRSLKTVFILWLVLTFLFFFFRLMPGSFTDMMMHQGASAEAVAKIEERWGLNDPLHIQYYNYLTNFLVLDVGMSLTHRMPVWDYVKPRIFNTLILAVPAITASYIIGGIVGSVIGEQRDSRLEKSVITLFTVIGSFPAFFTGILAIIIFAVWLPIFPTGGMLSTDTMLATDANWWDNYLSKDFLWHYTLPFTVIALQSSYSPTLIMRTSFIEVMGQDFAYYQKVSGLPYARRLKHLGRHAVLPLVTLYPISMVRAVSGLVLVELVFNWPGLGYALIQAIQSRNFPVVQFVFFSVAALVILSNFAVDIFYGVIDPRISIGDRD